MTDHRFPTRLLFIPLAVLCFNAAACDPFVFEGIAVTPEPNSSSERVSALTIAAELAHERGMKPASPPYAGASGWQCFAEEAFRFCGNRIGAETQFEFAQAGLRFSASVRRFQEQFRSRLRSAFGAEAVTFCVWEWRNQGRGGDSPAQYICV